jgi:hypothetical protein
MSENFNPQQLVDFRKVSAFPNHETIDPETRLAQLKTNIKSEGVADQSETELADLQRQTNDYLLNHKLVKTERLLYQLKYPIASQIILKVQPKTKEELSKLVYIIGRLMKHKIMDEATLLKYDRSMLNEIDGFGDTVVNKLEAWYFSDLESSDSI